jgi:hypothetical protein
MESQQVPRRMVYKAVRNYITNELGLSQETILATMKQHVREVLADFFKGHANSDWFKLLVSEAVKRHTQEQVRKVLEYSTKITVDIQPR